MGLIVWRDLSGQDHYHAEIDGKLYPFGLRDNAEWALAHPDNVLNGNYAAWDEGLLKGWTDVTKEVLGADASS